MTWMITGGAGYIGAHLARDMDADSTDVVVVDNLSTGRQDLIKRQGIPFEWVDITEPWALRDVLIKYNVEGVIHLAGASKVEESVSNPLHYYNQNVYGTLQLLDAMQSVGVKRLVFASSAAVYGDPETSFLTEDAPLLPISPYGNSKLAAENVIRDAAKAYDMSAVILRLFNVAGAGGFGLGDRNLSHLLPAAISAMRNGERVKINGAYATPDGTAYRDYVAVQDVVEAFEKAADLTTGNMVRRVQTYNIGSGVSTGVATMLRRLGSAAKQGVDVEVVDRRPGDPEMLIADTHAAYSGLGWFAEKDVTNILADAWNALPSAR